MEKDHPKTHFNWTWDGLISNASKENDSFMTSRRMSFQVKTTMLQALLF